VEAQPASAEAAVNAEKDRKLRRERGFSKLMAWEGLPSDANRPVTAGRSV